MEDTNQKKLTKVEKNFEDLKTVMNDWIEFLDSTHSETKSRVKELEERIRFLELNKRN